MMLVPKLAAWFEAWKLETKGGFKWSEKLVSS